MIGQQKAPKYLLRQLYSLIPLLLVYRGTVPTLMSTRYRSRDVELNVRVGASGSSNHLTVHQHEFDWDDGTRAESDRGHEEEETQRPLLILCIHGAGYSGLTFAPLADALLSSSRDCGGDDDGVCTTSSSSPLRTSNLVVVAPDMRGHGATTADDERDLSIETLLLDVEALYTKHLAHRFGDVVLVGWSMGAAVAIKLASMADSVLASRVVGLVAIDVVEGTAMEALKSMAAILAIRPKGFDSVDEAVEWAVSSGTARRRESAEISVPGMLIEAEASPKEGGAATSGGRSQSPATTEKMTSMSSNMATNMATNMTTNMTTRNVGKMGPPPPIPRYPPIVEGTKPLEEKEARRMNDVGGSRRDGRTAPSAKPPYKYVWRVALERTEPFWMGWFQGLSQAFLDVSAPKLLLLAGHDRLDKTLTIAQMQGKFQMAVVPRAGHAIHEDQPKAVADKIWGFLCRHLAKPVGF